MKKNTLLHSIRMCLPPLRGFSNLRPTLCRSFHCDIPLDGKRSSEEALFNGDMTRVNCAGRRTWPSGVRDGIARFWVFFFFFFPATAERKRLHPDALALRVTTQRVGLDPSFSGCHFHSHAAITLASRGHAKLARRSLARLAQAAPFAKSSRGMTAEQMPCLLVVVVVRGGEVDKGLRKFCRPGVGGLEIALTAPYTFVGALLLTLTCRQSFVDRWGAGLCPAVLCPGLSLLHCLSHLLLWPSLSCTVSSETLAERHAHKCKWRQKRHKQ